MTVYKRGGKWSYKFRFAGQLIRESTKSASESIAKRAERKRRQQLEEGFNGITRPQRGQIFSVTAEKWLKTKQPDLAPRTIIIERMNLKHLNPFFGKNMLCDLTPDDVAIYQGERLQAGAAPKTVNLEIGTLRAILRKNRLWAGLQPDVRMLKVREEMGRAISHEEEGRLLEACSKSRSRSLYPAVVLALNTAMRLGEIRMLTWEQIDFAHKTLRVGRGKTLAGEGRVIPLNQRAYSTLELWRSNFPDALPEHFAFPQERYGQGGPYRVNYREPILSWRVAWENAKGKAGVSCRFHDLRHTCISRLAESPASDQTIMSIAGHVSRRMLERYSHIRLEAKRQALEAINNPQPSTGGGAQNWAQFPGVSVKGRAN